MSDNDWPCILLYNHKLNKMISSERFGQNPNQLILTSGLVLGDWPTRDWMTCENMNSIRIISNADYLASDRTNSD